jgi:hypothetical protein
VEASVTDLTIEDIQRAELERDQRLGICCCCSIGVMVRTGTPADTELTTEGYVCDDCKALHVEVDQARVDYIARTDAAMDAHHALHDERAGMKEQDDARRWQDVITPEPIDPPVRYVPPATEAWISVKHPEIDWLVHLGPDERAPYRHPDFREALRRHLPGVPNHVWKVLLG